MIEIQALLGIILLSYFLYYNIVIKKVYVSIINIVLIVTIVDIYVPAILGHLTGGYLTLNYLKPITDEEVTKALFVVNSFMVFLLFGYFLGNKRTRSVFVIENCDIIKRKWVYLLLFFATGCFLLNIYYEFKSYGDMFSFLQFKLARAYAVKAEPQSSFAYLVGILTETTHVILLMIVSIALLNKRSFPKRFLTYLTLIIVLFCILSLSRGTIISLFICIFATIELKQNGNFSPVYKRRFKNIFLIGVFSFLLFGGLRTAVQNEFWGEANSEGLTSNIVGALKNTLGSSLIAVSRVVRYIDGGGHLYYGQSYEEMFLSLIPRSILPDKPELYGVETLTLAMGSPESTMDAITMPGEAIMNFGYCGVLFGYLWGLVFRLIDSFRRYKRIKYFWAAAVFVIGTTCCWMSFTGLFAQTKYLVIYYFALCLMIPRKQQRKVEITH